MGGVLQKSRIVLSRGDEDVFADPAGNSFQGVLFGSEGAFAAPGDRSACDHTTVILPRLTWVELGEPDEITVTLEPGDKLN